MPQTSTRTSNFTERLAVCSWSLQAETPDDWADKMAATGLTRAQLALNPLREKPEVWRDVKKISARRGLEIISGTAGCVGEDYSTLETIERTGGIVPDETWPQNQKNFQAGASLAADLNLKLVTLHAGFLPPDKSSAAYAKMLLRLETVAAIFAGHGIALGLETGQETADALAEFLSRLNCPTLGVNFDPANVILYDNGDPLAALRILSPWLRQVHIKDATRTKIPGTWGQEVPVGAGEVDWLNFFAALRELNFTGNLAIEREAGHQRVADIVTARDFVLKFL